MKRCIDHIDKCIVAWMRLHGLLFLRVSLAVVFIWFGLLKVVGISPAGDLVVRTVFWWDPSWFLPILGLWECVIGACFLFQRTIRIAILLMAFQMVGTIFPFFVLPQETFTGTILTPTMEGQYIIKNIVLIAAAIVIGSHARDKSTTPRRS